MASLRSQNKDLADKMNNSRSFSVNSQQYARYRPSYPESLFSYLSEISPGHTAAWDCATGSGQAAVACANWFSRVEATDISQEQIQHAAARPKIHYSVCSAEAAPFAKQTFDLITVAQALHWFDRVKFYQEAERVLKPGGILAVFGYGFFEINPAIDRVINETLHARIDPFWAQGNRLLMSGYRDVSMPFQELNPPRHFAMRLEWNLRQLLEYLRTWSAVKGYVAELGTDPVVELESKLKPVWGIPEKINPVIMPLFLRISRKSMA